MNRPLLILLVIKLHKVHDVFSVPNNLNLSIYSARRALINLNSFINFKAIPSEHHQKVKETKRHLSKYKKQTNKKMQISLLI